MYIDRILIIQILPMLVLVVAELRDRANRTKAELRNRDGRCARCNHLLSPEFVAIPIAGYISQTMGNVCQHCARTNKRCEWIIMLFVALLLAFVIVVRWLIR